MIINFILVLTAFCIVSCFKKAEVPVTTMAAPDVLPKITTTQTKPPELLSKIQRESIYFSASLEREALRILLKNATLEEQTLFSVLSFAVEAAAGVKKMAPGRLDCSRFRFEKMAAKPRSILIYKTCQKPETLIGNIEVGLTDSTLKIIFFIREWGAIVGLPVALTGTDTICEITIADKKLDRLDCQNWARTVSASDISAEELRLKVFSFNRKASEQFVLKGGRFKDLIERKKIELQVPIEGRIRLIEKEIDVIDEFSVRMEPVYPTPPPRLEIKGNSDEKSFESPDQKTPLGGQDSENGGIPPAPQDNQGNQDQPNRGR